MLASLNIQNIVLIEKLNIEFKSDSDLLYALTGETGAGKSILLDALGLSIGARAETRYVRKGAEKASVHASFDIGPDHPVFTILKDNDLEFEPGEPLVLRRSITSDGRSKAFVNDQPVSASLLRDIGEYLVEIHGQFDTQGLLNPASHRGLLDEYAEIDGALADLWNKWKSLEDELTDLKEETEKSRAEEEYLRSSLEDLDSLNPEPGEEETLSQMRERLMNKERVLEALNTAYHALNSENDPVRQAWSALDRIADKLGDEARAAIDALDRASSEIQEALSEIQSLSSDLEESEHDLQSVDDRLHELRSQARKHQCEPDDLPGIRDEIARKLGNIEHSDDMLAAKMKEAETAREAYIKAAESVSGQRQKAAVTLDDLVQKELPPLKLEKARFVTQIEKLEEESWGPHGMDQVRFLVATNPGSDPGPLNKIASGGEMARFMLALKVVMAEGETSKTMIFDEVDAGVGGATADAVGERLARLAGKHQILVVTHSPQVAARAGHHLIVQKGGAEHVTTNVIPLNALEERKEEIARMLSGAQITPEARAAASKLLETGT